MDRCRVPRTRQGHGDVSIAAQGESCQGCSCCREVVPNRTARMSIRDAAEAGRFAVGPASFQRVPETEEAANTAYRPLPSTPARRTIVRWSRRMASFCSSADGRARRGVRRLPVTCTGSMRKSWSSSGATKTSETRQRRAAGATKTKPPPRVRICRRQSGSRNCDQAPSISAG